MKKTNDADSRHIPAGYVINPNGTISKNSQPPKTGVDSADRFIPLALLSLLGMAVLITLRRREA